MKHALMAFWVSAACLVLGFGSDPGSAQHSAMPQAGPVNAVVEFENESIVVVRIRMAPGEKTPMHDITSARLVVWLTHVSLRDTHADGSTDDIRRRAGDIDWIPVQRHSGENLAHEPLEFLAIVPKTSAAR